MAEDRNSGCGCLIIVIVLVILACLCSRIKSLEHSLESQTHYENTE